MEIFKKEKAMTLIELLVVIAIIFILAAIAYTQLWGARKSAKEAQVKATMSGLPPAAEVYYLQNDYNYEGVCGEDNFDEASSVCSNNPYPGTWSCNEYDDDSDGIFERWDAKCENFADGVTFTCDPTGCE